MKDLLVKKALNKKISRVQFLEDLDCLFASLKELYGMYDYFGDSKFIEAKEVIENLLPYDFNLENAVVILKDGLSFIRDGHFYIGAPTEDKIVYDYAIQYGEYKGIQVIDCKKFYSDTEEEEKQLEDFSNKGREYQNSNTLILDFRGNVGGSSEYIYTFLEGLTGQEVGFSFKLLQRYSNLYKDYLEMKNIDWIPEHPDEYQEEICPKVKNAKKIYVLIDEKTGSAAEEGIAVLKNMENVIIVGEHSGGHASCGNCLSIFLPNSHLEVYFGTGLILYDGYRNIDAEGGFKGDISYKEFDRIISAQQSE